MNIFFVDFGSTFVKFAVYDSVGREYICAEKRPFPDPCVCNEKHFEVSESSIRELIFSVFDFAAFHECRCAYISVQMHGYLIRGSDGSMSNYISWRDSTGNTEGMNVDFFNRGTSLKSNLPFVKLYREENKDKEFFTLGSYVAYLLTGRNITNKTDGCASGFFNVATLMPEDVSGLKLPIISNEVMVIGRWNGISVYTPMGDHQISYFGSGAGDDSYLINIGTATQISCLEQKMYTYEDCEARPYFTNGRLITRTGLTGGSKLYHGEDPQKLCKELVSAIKQLPQRNHAVIGGGGSAAIFPYLQEVLAELGISCRLSGGNIGMEGLRLMSETQKTKIGTMLSEIAFSNFPIILKNADIDFFIIDCEHGAFDYHVLSELITKAKLVGIKAIVRIGDNRREFITKLADMGASGFLLSMTGGAEDISTVVKYAKYSPVGKRGISTTRAHTLYNPPKLSEYMQNANCEMKIYAQIETAEGVSNAASILAVNGVDGVFIGPNDLSDDLDCIGDIEPVKECISKIANAAEHIGKPWGIITSNPQLIEYSTVHGVNMVSCGSELNMLIDGCRRLTQKVNGGVEN